VGGDLLRKLLGRPRSLAPDAEEALGELAKLADQRPALGELARELSAIVLALYAEPIQEAVPALDPKKAANKRAAGVPLLRDEPLSLDTRSFVRRWQRITEALRRRRPDAATLQAALGEGKLDPAWLTTEVLAGRTQAVHERVEELQLDVPLTASVLWLSLFPVLCYLRKSLESLRQGVGWRDGFCPTCGAWPKLGEFRGLEQTRFLRCGLCADAWEFPRLRCPFCGNADHQQIGYLHVEGEETQYRAATCEACRHYVKMLATLGALPAPRLLIADLATMHLDLAAAERGYTQPL
jgi:FdhE protein